MFKAGILIELAGLRIKYTDICFHLAHKAGHAYDFSSQTDILSMAFVYYVSCRPLHEKNAKHLSGCKRVNISPEFS